ncbi:unnamed protein product, partial [Bubo scandiacus]
RHRGAAPSLLPPVTAPGATGCKLRPGPPAVRARARLRERARARGGATQRLPAAAPPRGFPPAPTPADSRSVPSSPLLPTGTPRPEAADPPPPARPVTARPRRAAARGSGGSLPERRGGCRHRDALPREGQREGAPPPPCPPQPAPPLSGLSPGRGRLRAASPRDPPPPSSGPAPAPAPLPQGPRGARPLAAARPRAAAPPRALPAARSGPCIAEGPRYL